MLLSSLIPQPGSDLRAGSVSASVTNMLRYVRRQRKRNTSFDAGAASAERWLRDRLASRSNVFLGIEIDCNCRNEAVVLRRSSFCQHDEFVLFGSEVAAPKPSKNIRPSLVLRQQP